MAKVSPAVSVTATITPSAEVHMLAPEAGAATRNWQQRRFAANP